jgi:chromate transporter
LFLEFLKLGSIVFGSGYVLVTYLHSDLVLGNHWLTQSQLLATVAIGQLTPGPIFTTATSIGYLLGGLPGALVATVAIFVPSFLFVAALMPLLGRARRFKWSASALDGVNVAAIALMAGVTLQLGRTSLVDWLTVLTGVASLGLLLRWRVNATWLVLGGVGIGLLHAFA